MRGFGRIGLTYSEFRTLEILRDDDASLLLHPSYPVNLVVPFAQPDEGVNLVLKMVPQLWHERIQNCLQLLPVILRLTILDHLQVIRKLV